MDKQMEILLTKINEKFDEQTITLTTSITKNVMEALDEKMKILMDENSNLKEKVTKLEQKITFLENEKRKKNLVFFGIEENGKTDFELVDFVRDLLVESGTHIDGQEISGIHRIGARSEKNRPVIISLTTTWKKQIILRNKRNLPPNVYVKEDFPKDILEIRKQLQPKLVAERKNGNIAYIKYNKLIVKKPNDVNREKRKRVTNGSPTTSSHKKSNTNIDKNIPREQLLSTTKETTKPNLFTQITRGRTASMSDLTKNK